MRLEVQKYLFDVRQACERIREFTFEQSFADYQQSPMLRAAVERQFEIIGEALNRLFRLEPDLADRITDGRRIIAFRNILVHAYAQIDNRVVWGVIESELRTLETDVAALLGE